MTNEQVQKKLNQLVKIANELEDEAKTRYGPDGSLFHEAEGSFHLMDGDSNGRSSERQTHVRFTSEKHCNMGAGAW